MNYRNAYSSDERKDPRNKKFLVYFGDNLSSGAFVYAKNKEEAEKKYLRYIAHQAFHIEFKNDKFVVLQVAD